MLGGKLGEALKAARALTQNMEKMQAELAATVIEGTAGGGLVTVRLNGVKELLDVKIDGANLGLSADDTDLLQDAFLAAVQEAMRVVDEKAKDTMADMTEGLELPPGVELPPGFGQ